ncbi:MAG: autotransporter domain-containing protein [Planktotalea sp.]|uniref:autotransporter domain-containing protein n=1 Tax=Planktotalea sp. TaxID=2029877 RepID=UPI003C7304B7
MSNANLISFQTPSGRFARKGQVSALALVVGLFAVTGASAQSYSITNIGDLPNGQVRAAANGISDDGSLAIGTSSGAVTVNLGGGMGNVLSVGSLPFRWTSAGGMVSLGALPGGIVDSYANGVSADGSIVVGGSSSAAGFFATRWSVGKPVETLGDLAGGKDFSLALDVSDDGKIVVGQSSSAIGNEAFRWAEGDPAGMTGLGFLGTGTSSDANGVSGDGTVIVGSSETGTGNDKEAYRWTSAGGMVSIGDLAGGQVHSVANDTNKDGSVIVGYGRTAAFNQEAFRWTQAGGMVALGQLPNGTRSLANAVSDDGMIVVGQGSTNAGEVAFRWTQETGIKSLQDLLVAKNVDMTGIKLGTANEISADGKFIVGEATTAAGIEAYIAVYQDPVAVNPAAPTTSASTRTGVLFVNDFTTSANSVSNTSRIAGTSGQGIDNGLEFAGLNYDLGGGSTTVSTQGPALGGLSYAGFAFGEGSKMLDTSVSSRDVAYGGIGVMANARSIGLRFGLGALAANQTTTTSALGSSSTLNALGAGIWVTYAPAPTGIELMFAASRLNLDAKIDRNYLNGAATETSSGTTSGTYTGLQGRIGYGFKISENLILTPFAGVSSHSSSLAGYTETGGTFFGTVTGQNSKVNKVRLGLDALFRVRSDLEFTGGLSFERVSETGTLSTIGVTSLAGATFGGGLAARDYNAANVSLGVNYQISNGITLHSEIDMSRSLTVGASDTNRAGIKFGATISF